MYCYYIYQLDAVIDREKKPKMGKKIGDGEGKNRCWRREKQITGSVLPVKVLKRKKKGKKC